MRSRFAAILAAIPWLWIVPSLSLLPSARASAVNMEWVAIGNPGNLLDLHTGFGAVAYPYEIGKYEVTNDQYAEFLNAVDPSGGNALGLYDSQMGSSALGGINFVPGNALGSKYVVKSGRGPRPVNFVSQVEAVRFANWMQNGQGIETTETGAYAVYGGTLSNQSSFVRSPDALVFLPSGDEWYKAAYYDGASATWFEYPAGTNFETTCAIPSGSPNRANCDGVLGIPIDVGAYTSSPSPYGTFDQGGNVGEIYDSGYRSGSLGDFWVTGGSYLDPAGSLAASNFGHGASSPSKLENIGFRLARLAAPQCSDGIDDDGDGLIDYPADPGCTSLTDAWETPASSLVDVGTFLLQTSDQNGGLLGSFAATGFYGGALSRVGQLSIDPQQSNFGVWDLGPPVRGTWAADVVSPGLSFHEAGSFTCSASGCNLPDGAISFVGGVTNVSPSSILPPNSFYTTDGYLHPVASYPPCITSGNQRCFLGNFALNAFPQVTTSPSNRLVGFDSSYYSAAGGRQIEFQGSVSFEGGVGSQGQTAVTAVSSGAATSTDFATETADGYRATYFDVQTTANYTPPIAFCTTYEQPPATVDECKMSLLHYEYDPVSMTYKFVDHTIGSAQNPQPDPCPLVAPLGTLCTGRCINPQTNQICARTQSLSPFVVAVDLRPACSNGYDDDGDGLIDYPADPQCASAFDPTEQSQSSSIHVDTTADELTTNGNCSLREAILAANTDTAVDGCAAGADFDNIYIPAGTYTLTLTGANEDGDLSGDLNVRSPLALIGAGAGVTVIDATGLGDRVLHVQPPASGPDINVEIRDLTLRGGSGVSSGGGLLIQESSPPGFNPTTILQDSVIEHNTAVGGGGLRLEHPNGGTTTISRTAIRSNTATGAGGGGIDSFAASVFLLDSTVEANVSSSSAGGIYDNKSMTIRRSTIAGNQSTSGPGGIFAAQDALSIVNSTISGNTTGGPAGGMAVGDASNGANVLIQFTTVTANSAAQGGGIQVGPSASAVASIGANLVAGNTAATNPDVDGSIATGGDNVIGIGGTSTGWGAGDHVGTAGSPINAKLAALAANGGFAKTHALLAGSPAIDSANCIGVGEDQRHVVRPYGVRCDSGAFENAPPCADGIDNDGDGLVDYPADPGCFDATSFSTENPACQDGLDNDGDGKIDFDGGASANHGVALGAPDPQCTKPYRTSEKPNSCGLGAELAFLLPALMAAARRNARRGRVYSRT